MNVTRHMSVAPQMNPGMNPVQKGTRKLTPATNRRTPKAMPQIKKHAERGVSRVPEKTERLGNAMNLQILRDPARSSRPSSRGTSKPSSREKVERPPLRRRKQLLVRRQLGQMQFRHLQQAATKTHR